jgi:hypothetical protein
MVRREEDFHMTLSLATPVTGRLALAAGLAVIGTITLGADAVAQTAGGLGSMARTSATDLLGFESWLSLICYLGAAGTGISAVMKFKEHGQSPNQVKLSDPIIRTAVAVGLVGLPMLLGAGVSTMFGGNSGRAISSSSTTRSGAFNIR